MTLEVSLASRADVAATARRLRTMLPDVSGLVPLAIPSELIARFANEMREVETTVQSSGRPEALVRYEQALRANQMIEAADSAADAIVTAGNLDGDGCELSIMLKPTILDGSEIRISLADGGMSVAITPATQSAAAAIGGAIAQFQARMNARFPSRRIKVKVG